MLLAVDVGNTNVTIGSFRNGSLVAVRRASTPGAGSRAGAGTGAGGSGAGTGAGAGMADELELLLEGLLRLDDAAFADVSALVAASVVPGVSAALEAIASRRDRPLLVAGAGTVPVAIRVDRPADVGPDRLVNAFAASRLYGLPSIVIDLGTATTFDCVAHDGAFVGGAIAPGVELGLAALASGTARLPRVDLRTPERAIGRDTGAAIQSGTVLGHVAMVQGLLARTRRELADAGDVAPQDVHVILTGGLSNAPFAGSIEGATAIDPDLTLKGLAILHAEVAGGTPLELPLA
jgi:type III pantothenate kinase